MRRKQQASSHRDRSVWVRAPVRVNVNMSAQMQLLTNARAHAY